MLKTNTERKNLRTIGPFMDHNHRNGSMGDTDPMLWYNFDLELYQNNVATSYHVGCIEKSCNINGLQEHNTHDIWNP